VSRPRPELQAEPLGDQDRAGFACGVPELDEYLQVRARQDARRNVAAPFVLVDNNGRVAGYYTLSSYAIHLTERPPEIARKLPRYPLVPATLLGRFALDSQYHGRKLAQFLLMDALFRSHRNTTQVASVGVVAEAINDRARDFYLHHGFFAIAGHPQKLFVSMQTIERAFGPAH
jgi:GNAT superfamily N-acetyltransferase